MSSAPLDRDLQISLMQTAPDRFDDLMHKWEGNTTVANLMRKEHVELSETANYSRHDERIRRAG